MAVEGNMLLKNAFEVLSERLAHGVRPELLQLTSLEGVGRVRARNLYNAGYRTLEDLRRASVEELAMVHTIGPKTAELIKKQL
jgi:helicase